MEIIGLILKREDIMKVSSIMFKFIVVLSCIILLTGSASISKTSSIQTSSEPQLLRKSFTSLVSNTEREYWLYLPRGYNDSSEEKLPVIMFLHGGGERGEDINKVLKHGPIKEVYNGRDLPFIIIAPQMPSMPIDEQRPSRERRTPPVKTGRKSMLRTVTGIEDRFDSLGPPQGWNEIEKDLIMILDNTLKNYRADPNRMYLTGLSYGGFGTWYMAIHHPDRWAAVAPICGAGDNSQVHKIGKTPVWLFQGGRDNVVPPEISLKTADILDAAGGNVRVTVHEDLPHDCWTRVYSGEDIYNWFLSHSR